MVQFKSPNVESSNEYWRLEHGESLRVSDHKTYLAKAGYYCPTNVSRASVTQVFGRYQRQLLQYGRYNIATLRGFCQARGLLANISRPKSRTAFVRVLETADEDATFERLFDLPREIRDMIYGFHFEGYASMFNNHHQPPVTVSSRQLRDEALPAFYKHCIFPLQMGKYAGEGNALWPLGDAPTRPELSKSTMDMVKGITDHNFASIRHLSARVHVYRTGRSKLFDLEIRLDLSPNVHTHDTVSIRCLEYGPRPYGFTSSRWRPCDPRTSQRQAFTHCEREMASAVHRLLEDMQFKTSSFVLRKDFAKKFQDAVTGGLDSARTCINQGK